MVSVANCKVIVVASTLAYLSAPTPLHTTSLVSSTFRYGRSLHELFESYATRKDLSKGCTVHFCYTGKARQDSLDMTITTRTGLLPNSFASAGLSPTTKPP